MARWTRTSPPPPGRKFSGFRSGTASPSGIHSDLLPGNLLVRQGRLSALIDCFGLTAEHYYRVKNPVLAGIGLHAVSQALADHQHGT
jgi:hypothetical protein